MAEPKKKLTKARRGWRRSHDSFKPLKLSFCPKCKERKFSHQVCPDCGYYKGKKVINVDKA